MIMPAGAIYEGKETGGGLPVEGGPLGGGLPEPGGGLYEGLGGGLRSALLAGGLEAAGC